MSQLQNNDFFDPYLLSFGLKNKAIFINDSSIINQRYQQLVALNDQFKAIITFQTKPIILILYLDISNNSIKISRRNDDLEEISINTLYIKEFNIVDIYNVFPSSNEEILYVQMYADNDKLVTISIKNDTKYDTVPFNNLDDNIEVISSKSQNYLTLREKPGHGYAATIFSSDIISLDNYLCRFGELIANKNIINNTEFLTITDLSSCKTVFEMKLEHPLIVSKIINNEVVLCLCNKEGINVLLNINYRTGQIISETEYQCSIEFHAQIKNRVMIKLMGLSEGVL